MQFGASAAIRSNLLRSIFPMGASQPDPCLLREKPIEAIEERHGSFRTLETPEHVEAKPFPIFGEHALHLVMKRALPSRSAAVIRNCLVHGHSTATMTTCRSGGIHWATIPELSLSSGPGNYAQFFELSDAGWIFAPRPCLKPTIRVERAVLLGTRYTFNYFHFVTDLMARLLIAETQWPGDTSPLLVPAQAPQLLELLRMVTPGRAILMMAPDDLVRVGELAIPSSAAFSPDSAALANASVFDVPYLASIRERLAGIHAPGSDRGGRIVFVRRTEIHLPDGTRLRNIVNQAEVIAHMKGLGAAIVQPETMTMAEQAAIFRQADIVVGMAGAALTNAIFCRPGTTVVLLCQNQDVSPEYFALMLDALGHRYAVVAGKGIPGTSAHPSHLSIQIDLNSLADAMTWAQGR